MKEKQGNYPIQVSDQVQRGFSPRGVAKQKQVQKTTNTRAGAPSNHDPFRGAYLQKGSRNHQESQRLTDPEMFIVNETFSESPKDGWKS